MKSPRLLLTVLFGISCVMAAVVSDSFASVVVQREFRYEAARFRLTAAEAGTTRLDVRGASRDYTPGHPDLPLVSERIELPVGQRLVGVRVLELQTAPLASGVRLSSSERPRQDLTRIDRTEPDPAIFGSAEFFPATPVEIGAGGFERGRNIAFLVVSPARWSPATGQLDRVERLRVELVLEADAARPLERERVVPEWEEGALPTTGIAGASVVLPGVGRSEPFKATQIPSLQGSPVEYVIVTGDEMASAFQVLADWKTACGVPAVVRTMSFIRQQYPRGADDAERVRSFLRDAYTRWGTKWVLLGGDTQVVPTRLAYTTYYVVGGEHIATDLYFSCLEGNWNADGDSLYGEGRLSYPPAPGDSCDLMPEVYVGRLPATTAAEAELLVSKALRYERDPISDYMENSLFFAEVLFPQDWLPEETFALDGAGFIESDILPIMDTVPNIHYARLYENYTWSEYRPGSLPERRTTVIDSLNRGYNVAIHVGHGYRNVMHVADDNLTGADAAALVNGDRLTNLYAINCSSTSIDYPCIAEALMKAEHGGTVSLVGSTRYDFPTTGEIYQGEFFHLLYEDGMNAVGELHAEQKVPYVSQSTYDGTQRWTQMTLVLLGDPELHIFTAAPRTIAVTAPATVGRGTASLAVHVQVGTDDLVGARVTAYRAGDVFATGLTDGSGDVTLGFQADDLGPIALTVTGTNCRPYRGTVEVVASDALALGEGRVVVADAGGGGRVGNGDGYWNAGETVDLYPMLANRGGARVAALGGTLSTTDALVTVLQATASYGAVAAGDSAAPVTGLRVSLPVGADDQREIPFTLTLTDSLGRSFVAHFQIVSRTPELRHYRHTVTDSPGDLDHVAEAGETVQYAVTLRNIGTGTAVGVTAKLRSPDGLVVVTDSTATWGDVAPGSDVTGDVFVFQPSSSSAQLLLVVSDAYGELLRQTLDLVPPAMPVSLAGSGGEGSITLDWAHGAETDLLGYNVYRSTSSGGTYGRVNVVPTDRTSYFEDAGLSPLTRYYYKVAAVDQSGNESTLSSALSVSTNPPRHSIFPVPTGRTTPAPVLLDHLYPGYPLTIFVGSDLLYAWHPDGNTPVDADGSGSTSGDFTRLGSYYAAGASSADLDGSGKVIVAPTWDDKRVYVYDTAGNVKAGWPATLADNIWSSAAIADVDGDGLKEIVVGSNGTTVYALRSNGAELTNGDANTSTFGVFKTGLGSFNPGTAAIAPLQNDGTQAIIFGASNGYLYAWRPDASNVPGFPAKLGAGVRSAPAVGDLDNDGTLDVVVPAMCDSLYVFRADGGRRTGFPVRVRMEGMSKCPSPALADMDRDGFLDIVQASTGGGIYVFNASGAVVSAPNLTPWSNIRYSSLTSGSAESSPIVADISGDGWPDVIQGDTNGQLTALSGADATVLPGFPIQLGAEVLGTPAAGDIDGDGMSEIVVACWDKNVYAWDYDFPFSPEQPEPPWAQFHHDPQRTGYAGTPVPTDVGDGGGEGTVATFRTVQLGPPTPNPAQGGTRLWFGVPAGRVGARLDLAIYDLSGRRVRTLARGTAEAGRHSVAWDLRDASGAPSGAGVYFARLATGPEVCTRKVVVVR